MSIFDEIYTKNGWGFGSGHGSLPRVTKGYRTFLSDFIKSNNVRSVVDYGCGDWQFSRLIHWDNVKYTGLDIVPAVIEQNRARFGDASTISFDVISPDEYKLPKADLLITKDVLQHLANESVKHFLQKVVPQYKFCLITNCVIPAEDLNRPIKTGEFRPLDIRLKPFNVHGAVVYTFTGPKAFSQSEMKFFPSWRKQVLLIVN